MSTRAVYTFKDEDSSYSVYKHYDGYPEGEGGGTGAFGFIKAAKEFAWELPRFDASEFAAAFIAANKNKAGGDVYMTEGPQSHSDLSYAYQITRDGSNLLVKVFEATGWDLAGEQQFIEREGVVTL
jgi:hypothetical protein